MKRMRSSPGTKHTTLWMWAAPDSEAKILRPVTRWPPGAGTARVE